MRAALKLSALLLALSALAAPFDRAARAETPTPEYRVVAKDGQFEIREYAPMIVAEVTVQAKDRMSASGAAFRALARYIFGGAQGGETIGMTAPVFVEKVENPDGPVLVSASRGDTELWTMGFIMPERYTMANLPKPTDARITLRETPARRVAAVTFSGSWRDAWVEKKRGELLDWLDARGERRAADPVYAFYNDPFTLPFNRRNEVMVALPPSES